jgi:hypothetical protein
MVIVGDGGRIFRRTGTTWQDDSIATTVDLHGVWCPSPPAQEFFAVGGNPGQVFRFNGTSWGSVYTMPATSGTLWSIFGTGTAPSDRIIAAGQNNTIARWDGSWSWETVNLTGVSGFGSVWASSPSDFYLTAKGGYVARWNGSQWSAVHTNVTEDLAGIWGTAASAYIFAATTGGSITRRDPSGGWQAVLTNSGAYFDDVWGTSATNVYAVSSKGIHHYDGTKWYLQHATSPINLHGIWGKDASSIFAVGDAGTVLAYTPP